MLNTRRILQLTLFGLNNKFYFKYFIHGALLASLLWLGTDYIQSKALEQGKAGFDNTYIWVNRVWVMINGLLYPYARYLYAKIWEIFSDDAQWYVGGTILLFVLYFKFIMRVCLFLSAIFIAPFAWLTLYFENRKFH